MGSAALSEVDSVALGTALLPSSAEGGGVGVVSCCCILEESCSFWTAPVPEAEGVASSSLALHRM